LSAWDLGYINTDRLIDRTRKRFDTVDRMERYRGHLYNLVRHANARALPPLLRFQRRLREPRRPSG